MSVYGFEAEYIDGNGDYIQFAIANGRRAYKRDSATHALNWRIFHRKDQWLISTDTAFNSTGVNGRFGWVKSDALLPYEAAWTNTTGVRKSLVSVGHGNVHGAENRCVKEWMGVVPN